MKRLQPKALSLCIALIFSGVDVAKAQFIARSDPFISVIDAMKHSISPILCMRPDPQPNSFTPVVVGTGFFVTAQGDVMTAAHVVIPFLTNQPPVGNCQMSIWFAGYSKTMMGRFNAELFPVPAKECILDQIADIALCHANLASLKDAEPVPVRFDFSQKPDGTAIAITGYPLLNLLPITSRGYIAAYSLDSAGPNQIALDRAAWPGGSGSPIYDEHGRVIGMLTMAGGGTASGISYARPSFAIQRFLTAHPLPVKQ